MRREAFECFAHDLFNMIQIQLHLQGVVDPVVAFFKEFYIGHRGLVLVMGFANGFSEPMGNQGTG